MKSTVILVFARMLIVAGCFSAALVYQHRYSIIVVPGDFADSSGPAQQTIMLDTLTGYTWFLTTRVSKDNPVTVEQNWETLPNIRAPVEVPDPGQHLSN